MLKTCSMSSSDGFNSMFFLLPWASEVHPSSLVYSTKTWPFLRWVQSNLFIWVSFFLPDLFSVEQYIPINWYGGRIDCDRNVVDAIGLATHVKDSIITGIRLFTALLQKRRIWSSGFDFGIGWFPFNSSMIENCSQMENLLRSRSAKTIPNTTWIMFLPS